MTLLPSLWLSLSIATSPGAHDAARRLYDQAKTEYALGSFEKALADFSLAYKQDPSVASLLFNIGQCHRLLGHWKEALFAYRGYLRERPAAPNRPEVESLIAKAERESEAKPLPAQGSPAPASQPGVLVLAAPPASEAAAPAPPAAPRTIDATSAPAPSNERPDLTAPPPPKRDFPTFATVSAVTAAGLLVAGLASVVVGGSAAKGLTGPLPALGSSAETSRAGQAGMAYTLNTVGEVALVGAGVALVGALVGYAVHASHHPAETQRVAPLTLGSEGSAPPAFAQTAIGF